MRKLNVRFVLDLGAIALVSMTLAVDRPRSESAKSTARSRKSQLCVGVLPAAARHLPPLLWLTAATGNNLPWDGLFTSSVMGVAVESAPFIFGFPEDSGPPPVRLPSAPAQTVSVSVNNNFFNPEDIRINAGDTVRWTWNGSPHTVTSGNCCGSDNVFCSPSDANCDNSAISGTGTVYTHTFNTPGFYPYFCRPHGDAMTGTITVDPVGTPTTIQFDAPNYNVTEGCVAATITVTRSGDTNGISTVDFGTSDGTASQRTDYTIASGTITFTAGQTSRTFKVLATDDAYVEGNETLTVTLSNATGASLGTQSSATVTVNDNDTTSPPVTQPIDDTPTFVCQHYHDFLSREPDPGGFDFWQGQITQCGSDQTCIHNKRLDVSNAFFFELEFQQTGAYVFRLYRVAYGNDQPFPNPSQTDPVEGKKLPSYAVFSRDRAKVIGGSNLAAKQLELANAFVARTEFTNKYPAS